METPKIQHDECLEELAALLKKNPDYLRRSLESKLYTCGMTDGSLEDCGRALAEIMEAKEIDPEKCSIILTGSHDKDTHAVLGSLKVTHPLEDCPYCGYETERFTDGAWGEIWQERRCLNPDCDYLSSTESSKPEFDFEDQW